jgi:hypothetical protein
VLRGILVICWGNKVVKIQSRPNLMNGNDTLCLGGKEICCTVHGKGFKLPVKIFFSKIAKAIKKLNGQCHYIFESHNFQLVFTYESIFAMKFYSMTTAGKHLYHQTMSAHVIILWFHPSVLSDVLIPCWHNVLSPQVIIPVVSHHLPHLM